MSANEESKPPLPQAWRGQMVRDLSQPERRGTVASPNYGRCRMHKHCAGRAITIHWIDSSVPGATCTVVVDHAADGYLEIPLLRDQRRQLDTGHRCSQCGNPAPAPPESHARTYAPRQPPPPICDNCVYQASVDEMLRLAPRDTEPRWADLDGFDREFLSNVRRLRRRGQRLTKGQVERLRTFS